MRGFNLVKKIGQALMVYEGFSTIEEFTTKEFQGTFPDGASYQAKVCVQDIITR